MSTPKEVLENLGDAIIAFANARKQIATATLLRETAINISNLSRIASNRIDDEHRREAIESATDHLVAQLHHAAWNLPVPPRPDPTQTDQA